MKIKEYRNSVLEGYQESIMGSKVSYSNISDIQELLNVFIKIRSSLGIRLELLNSEGSVMDEFSDGFETDLDSKVEPLNDDNKEKKEGFVYIAKQLNETDVYKIGVTNNIQKRGKTFRTGNAFVEMIASKKTSDYLFLEKRLHETYKNQRFSGEWFKLNKDDLTSIISSWGFNLCLDSKEAK